MKHLTVLCLIVASMFAVSCSTQKGAASTSISKNNVKGSWIVTDVQLEGIPEGSKVTVFDEASYVCFKGSQWVLPANANGSYTLSSTEEGCSTASQPVVWSLFNQGGAQMFQFKKVGTGVKAKNVAEGYRVELTSVNGNQMVWRAPVNFEDKTVYIIYTLQRR